MNWRNITDFATSPLALLLTLTAGGCAQAPAGKEIALASQGSFFVGGRKVEGAGTYDPTKATTNTNEGNTFSDLNNAQVADQMSKFLSERGLDGP